MSAHETAEAILLVIKRIAKWLFFGALIVMAVIASLYGGKILLEEYEDRPRLVTSIGNVTLGDKLTDVLFRDPDFILKIDYAALAKSLGGSRVSSSSDAKPTFDPDAFLRNTAPGGLEPGRARYKVQGPDGQIHIIEGPTHATPSEIEAIASVVIGQQTLEQKRAVAMAAARKAKAEAESRDSIGGVSSALVQIGDVEKSLTIYESEISSRAIEIENGYVRQILYACNERSDYTSVGGIRCGASGELILDRFKNAAKVQCLRDKSIPNYVRHRVYDVEKYGIRYHLMSNRVVEFNVMAPSILATPTGVRWGNCE